jgi:hypothetical protein
MDVLFYSPHTYVALESSSMHMCVAKKTIELSWGLRPRTVSDERETQGPSGRVFRLRQHTKNLFLNGIRFALNAEKLTVYCFARPFGLLK